MAKQRNLLKNELTEIFGNPTNSGATFLAWKTDKYEFTIATYSRYFNDLWSIFMLDKNQDKMQVLDKLKACQVIQHAKEFIEKYQN